MTGPFRVFRKSNKNELFYGKIRCRSKILLYAGKSEYLELVIDFGYYLVKTKLMSNAITKNASSADNQQERPEINGWIVGFTDGEGCFSVSIIRNKTSSLGWQAKCQNLSQHKVKVALLKLWR